jgi:Domain of unknown function (DUF397)
MNDKAWRKSSYSGNSGNCVEVCTSEPDIVAVRDSKTVPGPELALSGQAWSEFIQGIKSGQFDL